MSIKSKGQILDYKELSDGSIMTTIDKIGFNIYKIFGKAYSLKRSVKINDCFALKVIELKLNFLISCNN